MKQIFIKNGQVVLENIPAPMVDKNSVLVENYYSLISTGTELASIDTSGQSLIKKVLAQPDKIKQALKMFKKEGIVKTMTKAKEIIESEQAIGYSCAGKVIQVGENIKDLKIGDRVACAGAGKASHAEIVCVPRNLVVKIPDQVDFKEAASTTLGAIALQGLRRADPKIGETVAVIGLGLLGQLVVQLLKANGCRVIGIDLVQSKVDLARKFDLDYGLVENPVEGVLNFTGGKGADIVIITAATSSNLPVQQAMKMARKKGRVVIVGDVGLHLERGPFYEKELDLLISTSYGPGRYDSDYEEKGIDYPYAYVRWTENRNMQAYLQLLAEKKIDFQKLISAEYLIDEAPLVYQKIQEERDKYFAVMLKYKEEPKKMERKIILNPWPIKKTDLINVAVIGCGAFARGMHLPNLKKLSQFYKIYTVSDINGLMAQKIAKQYGAVYATTDYQEILKDKNVDLVFITLPHNLHAKVSKEAAQAGKAIFCEKPMALNEKELNELVEVLKKTRRPYLVGFNRRFSPLVKKIKEIIQNRQGPMIIDYQMNAGYLPKNHWTQTEAGGGRNLGEACHIYDLFTYFTESEIEKINAFSIEPKTEKYFKNDNFIASLKFKDGSICNLIYTALGATDYPKEQMKIYFDNTIIYLDDYKEMKIYGAKIGGLKLKQQDKGHFNEIQELAEAIKNGVYPIPLWQLIQATQISFEVEKQINQ